MAGAISSLKEMQWAFTDVGKGGHGYSVWSGDVDLDKWYHVAVVDDPEQGSVVMYINGIPMLRNEYGTPGVAHGINGFNDRAWIIGGSMYNNQMGTGFFGDHRRDETDRPPDRPQSVAHRSCTQGIEP